MHPSLWLRGAAAAAIRAGLQPDQVANGFPAASALVLRELLVPPSAGCVAHSPGREATQPFSPSDVHALVASVLRATPAVQRAAATRRFDPGVLRGAAVAAPRAIACDSARLLELFAVYAGRLGHAPTTGELCALLDAALAGGANARSIASTMRSARARGIDLVELLRPWRAATTVSSAGGTPCA